MHISNITEGGNQRNKITMGGDLLSKLPWLKPLLRTKFYSSCECNSAKPCSFFCRDCMGSAFCEDCLYHPHKHVGHQSLRVYKSSSRVGLRVKSIRKLMDVSDIQPYTCNSSKLVYINRKGRNDHVNRINGRKVDKCDVCGHELQCYSSKFCSIECKVQSEIEVEETEEEEVGISISTTRLLQVDPKSFRKRMRKGTPLRSPFF